jgi:hypothetical protein
VKKQEIDILDSKVTKYQDTDGVERLSKGYTHADLKH